MSKGIYRVGIVLSVVWIIFICSFAIYEWQASFTNKTVFFIVVSHPEAVAPDGVIPVTTQFLIERFISIIVLPLIGFWLLLLARPAITWVRSGFSSERKPASSIANNESIVAPENESSEPILSVTSEFHKPTDNPLPPIKSLVPGKWRAIPTLLVIFLLLTYWIVFRYAMDGRTDVFKEKELVYFLFFGGITYWYIWRKLNRTAWIGAIVGVAASLLVLFLGAGVAGYVRGQPSYILEHDPIFSAIKKSYPEDYDKILQNMDSKPKGKDMSPEAHVTERSQIFQNVLMKALRSTSDDALLQYGMAQVRMFQEVAASNAHDCLSMMSEQSDPASKNRIIESLSKGTKDAYQAATIKVIIDAGSLKATDPWAKFPIVQDPTRLEDILKQLDATLTTVYGSSISYFADDSLNKPAEVRCEAGLLFVKEVLNLPPQERSFMLREFFGGYDSATPN